MQEKILVVDDECEIANLIEVYLKNEGFDVCTFYTASDALDSIGKQIFDLAVLDVMLPDMSGFELCSKIREKENYPVIMLTAKDSEMDKIMGLTIGADDYITKPFLPMELMARVKAQLRRYKRYNPGMPQAGSREVLEKDGLRLDIRTHECFLEEEPVALTPTEFSILQILLERQGRVVGAEELFSLIWGEEYYSGNNTITVHIRHLREKLKDTLDSPKYIKTVWGVGYKIEA